MIENLEVKTSSIEKQIKKEGANAPSFHYLLDILEDVLHLVIVVV